MYRDKFGKPVSREVWSALFEDFEYRRVAETTLPNGYWVSTVWMGIDLGLLSDPLHFETMVFTKKVDGDPLDTRRYHSLDDAKTGHDAVVKEWGRNGLRLVQ